MEIIPIKSKYLIIKTMWKKPSTLTNRKFSLSLTSKTEGSAISFTSTNNISQLNNKCNEPLKEEELKTLKGGIKFIKELYSKINICYNFI